MKPIPYGRQNITDEDIQAVTETLKSDFLTQGPKVLEFEKAFAEYVGAQYAVAVMNGTVALHLGALALGVKAGTKVLTTPITFAASANSVLYCDGQVEFVDINPESFNIDLPLLEAKLKNAPAGTYSGIIPVDFAGYPVDLEGLRKLADQYGLWIMEDACHAPGGAFKDSEGVWRKCGGSGLAEVSVFSFHPVKHIACGEGGMITTNDKDLYQRILKLRTHGITRAQDELVEHHGGWHYEMQELGFNYRIPDMLCALGLSQLKRADQGLKRRREIAQIYYKELASVRTLKLPSVGDNFNHAYHLFVIRHEKRKELYDKLKERGIYCQVHYRPVYAHPYYRGLDKDIFLKNAEAYYNTCLSIPMFPSMTNEEVLFVCQSLKELA